MTREAFERAGLYQLSILGSGDHNMALAWVGKAAESMNSAVHPGYLGSLNLYQSKCSPSGCFRLGYLPGALKHYFHGSKQNRRYNDRWQILVKHGYHPALHTDLRRDGLIVPPSQCPQGLLDDIYQYFAQRNEDEA